jgi:hypothetical protein
VDIIAVLFIVVAGLLGLDFAALAWGADSRPTIGDDHRRLV